MLGYIYCNIPCSGNLTLHSIELKNYTQIAKYLITYINLVVNITLRSGDMRRRLTTETNCRKMHSRLCLVRRRRRRRRERSRRTFRSWRVQLFYLNSMKTTHSNDTSLYTYIILFLFLETSLGRTIYGLSEREMRAKLKSFCHTSESNTGQYVVHSACCIVRRIYLYKNLKI